MTLADVNLLSEDKRDKNVRQFSEKCKNNGNNADWLNDSSDDIQSNLSIADMLLYLQCYFVN